MFSTTINNKLKLGGENMLTEKQEEILFKAKALNNTKKLIIKNRRDKLLQQRNDDIIQESLIYKSKCHRLGVCSKCGKELPVDKDALYHTDGNPDKYYNEYTLYKECSECKDVFTKEEIEYLKRRHN
jgi:CO dehydrogenase/acetyl-CoA synthase alpha subunit